MAEERADAIDDGLGEHVLHLARGDLGVVQVRAEGLDEENLGETMPPHDSTRAVGV